jgi:ABC-type branched-subunit amino acid transport system ATPase component
MDAVFAVADTITVMVNGQVLESGPPTQISASAAGAGRLSRHGFRRSGSVNGLRPRPSRAATGVERRRAMSDWLLEARELHTYYGASHVLHGIDFRIGRGETVGLMGRNGMGKSTLIRSMLGTRQAARRRSPG